ncbi:nucleotidyltransferase domain-containing protein [Candidatus Woesearchaeota archaeon]|nr:nucleotidyltransferase domain-containing protein [Candidatus Woesearchaeota archaeon]
MNKQTSKAIAYAQNALSFVFLDPTLINKCSAIYLFGSAARGEMEKESDIDLFFDYESFFPDNIKNEKAITEKESAIRAALSRFSKSNDFQKWKQLGFTPPFSINAGELEEWELKTSVFADGILLYSKEPLTSVAKRHVLITYVLPQKKTKYLFVVRTLFGRKEEGYKDAGLIGACNAKRIATTVLLVPKEQAEIVFKFLQKEKIEYSFMEVGIL